MNTNSNAATAWKWSLAAVYFVAAMNLVLGWIANSSGTGGVGNLQLSGSGLIVAGLLYLILGIFAHNRARPALWIAIVLFALDSVAMVFMTLAAGHFSVWVLFIRFGLIRAMYGGIEALDQMAKA
jgi:hypothetical protein